MHCYDLYNAILFLAFNIQLRELDGDSNSSVIMLVQPQLRDLDRDSNCCARQPCMHLVVAMLIPPRASRMMMMVCNIIL